MSYVNFNRQLTKAQIEALTNATNGKIYFATDGNIYVGNALGTADLKANISEADMAAPEGEGRYIANKVGGFKILVDNDDIELNLSGTHTALDDFDFTFAQLTTAGCPQYAIDIMKYEPVTIWFYDSNETKVAEGETLYANDIEENGVSIVLHSDTTFTYASAVILNLANTSTYEGGNEIYYHIIKLPYNYLDITDNITDGDYHPVTSNAVYDIVGNIETLLASI